MNKYVCEIYNDYLEDNNVVMFRAENKKDPNDFFAEWINGDLGFETVDSYPDGYKNIDIFATVSRLLWAIAKYNGYNDFYNTTAIFENDEKYKNIFGGCGNYSALLKLYDKVFEALDGAEIVQNENGDCHLAIFIDKNGNVQNYFAAVALMDKGLMEEIHKEMAPWVGGSW